MFENNQKQNDQFFTRDCQTNLEVYFLSLTYFDLPKRTIGNDSHIKNLSLQISKVMKLFGEILQPLI